MNNILPQHTGDCEGVRNTKTYFFFPSDGSFSTKLISPVNLVEKLLKKTKMLQYMQYWGL